MSIHRLAKLTVKTLASHCARSYQIALTLLSTPLTYSMAYLRRDLRRGQGTFLHKGFLRRLELALYHLVIVPLVAFLPAPLAYRIACLRADWCYHWDTSKHTWITRSLECVLGDQLSLAERARVTRDYLRARSCEAIDLMRLAGKGHTLARLVEMRGLEHIEAALAAGKGAMLCSAHFGSYDSSFSLIGVRGFPITVVGRYPSRIDGDRSAVERFFFRLVFQKPAERHRRQPTIEPRMGQLDVAVRVATVLRRNELIGVLLDPPVLATDRKRAVQVDFLNGQALLLPGAITIAQLMGTPVLMMFLHRSADWRHQVLEISPPMPLDGDAVTAFKHCLAVVEEAIRRDPSLWRYWNPAALAQLGLLPEDAVKAQI